MPGPVPLAPAVTVTQASLLTAVQKHPAPTLTATVPVAAVALKDALVSESENEQGCPVWVTV